MNMVRTFAALSDPTRLAVVEKLSAQPHRAGELAAALGMSAPALSRHLRVLLESGVIADEAFEGDARVRVFRLERAAFSSMQGWLTEIEAFWDDQLSAFKAHAEKSPPAKPRGKAR